MLLALLGAGCAPLTKAPLGNRVASQVGDALIKEWQVRAQEVHALQGIARARVTSPERNGSVTQVVLVEAPDRFRAEILSPFGTPMLLLATNGEQLGALSTGQNTFYRGDANPENLGRFTRMPLQPADLVDLLLYRLPVFDGDRRVLSLPEGGWLVSVEMPGRRQELIFDDDRQLAEARYYDREELFLEVRYGRFGELVEDFPARYEIRLPEFETFASLDFSEQAVNRTFLPGIFELKPPAGSTILDLDGPS